MHRCPYTQAYIIEYTAAITLNNTVISVESVHARRHGHWAIWHGQGGCLSEPSHGSQSPHLFLQIFYSFLFFFSCWCSHYTSIKSFVVILQFLHIFFSSSSSLSSSFSSSRYFSFALQVWKFLLPYPQVQRFFHSLRPVY